MSLRFSQAKQSKGIFSISKPLNDRQNKYVNHLNRIYNSKPITDTNLDSGRRWGQGSKLSQRSNRSEKPQKESSARFSTSSTKNRSSKPSLPRKTSLSSLSNSSQKERHPRFGSSSQKSSRPGSLRNPYSRKPG